MDGNEGYLDRSTVERKSLKVVHLCIRLQAIYAIPINKQMNCKNQGRANYVLHGNN